MFILTFILFMIIIIILYNKRRNYWRKRGILQVDGILMKFLIGKRTLTEIYKDVYDKFPDVNHIGFHLGSNPTLLIKNSKDIKAVLSTDFKSFYKRGLISNSEDLLADNLLFMDDYHKWKIVRRNFRPIATTSRLKKMFDITECMARYFVENIDKRDKTKAKVIYEKIYKYTLAFTVSWFFDIDTLNNSDIEKRFMHVVFNSFNMNFINKTKFVIGIVFYKLHLFLNIKLFGKHEKYFLSVVKKIFERYRKREKDNDFLNYCVDLQEKSSFKNVKFEEIVNKENVLPTDELLAAQAFFFYVAGTDLTANVMHFALLELASHSKVLKDLHQEIDRAFDRLNGTLRLEDINNLTYLDMVLNETMRKYPPIGRFQRVCTKDTVLPTDNVIVRENETVVIPVYAIHRDPKIFPNPNDFIPERFSSENKIKIPKYAFMPYGEGQRKCIGISIAQLMIKTGLAYLLHEFTLQEQLPSQNSFDPSFVILQMSTAKYYLIPRNLKEN